MRYHEIQSQILDVYETCEIQAFPFDCHKVLEHYGYRIFTYQQLRKTNDRLYRYCCRLSDDAFHYKDFKIVAYDETKLWQRIRFSLMHELGHIILDHTEETPQTEHEANYFASHILVPRMAIYYSRCRNKESVAKLFDISLSAAELALDDYEIWYKKASKHMSPLDRRMYLHFYDSSSKSFIYHVEECFWCGAPVYNFSTRHYSELSTCPQCMIRQIHAKGAAYEQNLHRDEAQRKIQIWEEQEIP